MAACWFLLPFTEQVSFESATESGAGIASHRQRAHQVRHGEFTLILEEFHMAVHVQNVTAARDVIEDVCAPPIVGG